MSGRATGGAPVIRNVAQRSLTTVAREAILESIMADRFADGRIPPEQDLADMLGVSRTTVRSALQSLQDAGVIVRTRGRGTTVRRHARPSMLALNRLVGFTTMLLERGLTPSTAVSTTRLSRTPELVADALGLDPEQPCHLIEKVISADGAPAISISNHCPEDYLTRPFAEDAHHLDLFEFGERFGRVPIDHAVVEIRPAVADARRAEVLDLAEGTPMIILDEVHYSEDDEPLAHSEIAVHPTYVTFSVLRTA